MMFLKNRRKNVSFKDNDVNYGYAQIIIFGLNYSFKRVYRWGSRLPQIKLCLQFSYDYLLHIPEGIVALAFKRRLVLYGNKRVLLSFIKKFTAFRAPNIYTGKGLRFKSLPFHKKPGKVRRR